MSASAASPPPRARLWVLNLDAELELARSGGGPYATPERVARALAPMLDAARRLLLPGDRSLDPDTAAIPASAPAGRWLGAAWCPTPSAWRRLARAGAALPPCPGVDTLRRVNHRRFYLELGGGAPGARYVQDESDLRATLAETCERWLFKRPFGFAGRGQRRIGRAPSADDQRWLADGLRLGGLLAEPWLELARELALHGVVDRAGCVALGRPCVQETDPYRAWTATRRARPDELAPVHEAALRSRGVEVAAALTRAGYFGPFNLDAYLFRTPAGVELNPLSELNARFGMGFAVGAPELVAAAAGAP